MASLLLGNEFAGPDGSITSVPSSELDECDVVGLYFSAHWYTAISQNAFVSSTWLLYVYIYIYIYKTPEYILSVLMCSQTRYILSVITGALHADILHPN